MAEDSTRDTAKPTKLLNTLKNNLDTVTSLLGVSIDSYTLRQIMGKQAKTPTSPEIVASKMIDEGLLEKILRYMELVGGSVGEQYAENLRSLHAALVRRHPDYAARMREILFAGLDEKQALARIDRIYEQVAAANGLNDPQKETFLTTSNDPIVQEAIGKAQRVERANRNADKVAQEMIDNYELAPTLAISSEKLRKTVVARFGKLSRKSGKGPEKSVMQDQEGGTFSWGWIIFALLFFGLIILFGTLEPKDRPKGSEQIKEKISEIYRAVD
jgi:hypothetical protein